MERIQHYLLFEIFSGDCVVKLSGPYGLSYSFRKGTNIKRNNRSFFLGNVGNNFACLCYQYFSGFRSQACPSTHPYSLDKGMACCSHPNENLPGDPDCTTGDPITSHSMSKCCTDAFACAVGRPCKGYLGEPDHKIVPLRHLCYNNSNG